MPDKIELNKWGNIEMKPIRNPRGLYQAQVSFLLHDLLAKGVVMISCAVETAENTKVADVAWVSLERRRITPHEFAYAIAPEICVEVMMPGTLLEEMLHKGSLYLQAGAEEFWLCDTQGTMQFFNAAGPLERSLFCPEFPMRVKIPR